MEKLTVPLIEQLIESLIETQDIEDAEYLISTTPRYTEIFKQKYTDWRSVILEMFPRITTKNAIDFLVGPDSNKLYRSMHGVNCTDAQELFISQFEQISQSDRYLFLLYIILDRLEVLRDALINTANNNSPLKIGMNGVDIWIKGPLKPIDKTMFSVASIRFDGMCPGITQNVVILNSCNFIENNGKDILYLLTSNLDIDSLSDKERNDIHKILSAVRKIGVCKEKEEEVKKQT